MGVETTPLTLSFLGTKMVHKTFPFPWLHETFTILTPSLFLILKLQPSCWSSQYVAQLKKCPLMSPAMTTTFT